MKRSDYRVSNNYPRIVPSYYEYPSPSSEEYAHMRAICKSRTDISFFFPFVCTNRSGIRYIAIYYKDPNFDSRFFKRFIIREGYRLPEDEEEHFLKLLRDRKLESDYETFYRFNRSLSSIYPKWNDIKYKAHQIGMLFEDLYYSSYLYGPKEILYKAGLHYFAYNLDRIPSVNYDGTSPETIINLGMPLKLMRIMNDRWRFKDVFDDERRELYKRTYKKHSDRIGKELPSEAQWSYLLKLTEGNDSFGGFGFLKALYNRLESSPESALKDFEAYLLIHKEIDKNKRLRIPEYYQIEDAPERLELYNKYKDQRFDSDLRYASMIPELEYSDDEYVITVPRTAEELYAEANAQNNCLMTFTEPLLKGETVILFLRKRSEPDRSYVTIELKDNEFVQIYARFNTIPHISVYRFIDKYAELKGLRFDPHPLNEKEDCGNRTLEAYINEWRRIHRPFWFDYRGENYNYQMEIWELLPKEKKTSRAAAAAAAAAAAGIPA